MKTILQNSTVNRTLPDWRAIQLAARVPIKVLRQARDVHSNTSDELYFTMLDSIGVEAICDMVSQGCFLFDVGQTLDIPLTKIYEWFESDNTYIEKIEKAEEISAEAFLSASNEIVMGVKEGDTDNARVAKVKADHLRWLAAAKDRNKYGKQVSHNHSGGQTIEYRISLAAPVDEHEIIDVNSAG